MSCGGILMLQGCLRTSKRKAGGGVGAVGCGPKLFGQKGGAMTIRREIHERVLRAANLDELAEVYSDWAGSYDADLVGEMGYNAPVAAAELLHAELGAAESCILDAGCGTGLVGEALFQRGHQHITGIDYSTDMLEQARRKNVYVSLMQVDLTGPLEIDDDQYDAVVCVGTLTLGHVGPGALDEMVRVTVPGGYLCFTVREEAWHQDQYESAISRLEIAGKIQALQDHLIPYIEEEGSTCHLCLLRVR